MAIDEQLKAFLASGDRNAWLTSPQISVYVRKSMRVGPELSLMPYLDIASIEVPRRFRGKGVFRNFLNMCLTESGHSLYIENVHNPILRDALERRTLTDPRWRAYGPHFFWERDGAGDGI